MILFAYLYCVFVYMVEHHVHTNTVYMVEHHHAQQAKIKTPKPYIQAHVVARLSPVKPFNKHIMVTLVL